MGSDTRAVEIDWVKGYNVSDGVRTHSWAAHQGGGGKNPKQPAANQVQYDVSRCDLRVALEVLRSADFDRGMSRADLERRRRCRCNQPRGSG